jgi:hypothetical protein
MRRTRVRPAQIMSALESLHPDGKVARIVQRLAKEVERLDEDNVQLYASVMFYREVLRRHSLNASPAAACSNAGIVRDRV